MFWSKWTTWDTIKLQYKSKLVLMSLRLRRKMQFWTYLSIFVPKSFCLYVRPYNEKIPWPFCEDFVAQMRLSLIFNYSITEILLQGDTYFPVSYTKNIKYQNFNNKIKIIQTLKF